MALNALVDSFLPHQKKCGTERVKSSQNSLILTVRRIYINWNIFIEFIYV